MIAGALDRLLEVQEHDLALDRLAHRRATLPERAVVAGVEAELGRLGATEAAARAERDELAARQARLEADLESIVARVHQVERRLYGGTVSASRELSAMADEVRSLERHRAELEDRVIGLMEQAEPLDASLSALAGQRRALEQERARLLAVIAEAEAVIGAQEEAEHRARSASAAGLPSGLTSHYERLRARLGGVGAAKLVNGSCTGCHLALPAAERDRIRHLPTDALATCDQCGRILVR